MNMSWKSICMFILTMLLIYFIIGYYVLQYGKKVIGIDSKRKNQISDIKRMLNK